MSAAHTPGPWKVFLSPNGQRVIGVGDRNAGGITDQGDVSTNDQGVWRSGPEKIANAYLIAAAPDMLAALEAIDLARHTDAPADWQRATDLSDAAIAKALGRTPNEIGDEG